jgi:hypothetical protein
MLCKPILCQRPEEEDKRNKAYFRYHSSSEALNQDRPWKSGWAI